MKLDLNGINADSLVQMLKASFTLENWEGILQIADRLYSEINHLYSVKQLERADVQRLSVHGLNRSIVYYFGYSMCLKGIALEKLGRFDEARECITKYEELGWISGIDAEGWAEVEYYREIAQANRYIIELQEGNTAVLPDYLLYLRNNEEEVLPGVLYILDSAIKHEYNVNHVLDEFSEQIAAMAEYYVTKRNIRYYIDYFYMTAKYYALQGNLADAVNTLLHSLETSIKLKDDTGFRKSAALFEKLRNQTTSDQLDKYHGLIETILDREESK
ncbi:DNA-binding protein [Paenibacillus sp. PK3_47]|uniref:DNA-binding protein n=1 Tax=Paenibacillus sp. PK3_47 TaxID=2072642 RepID=UPI00201DCF46|nr:DNA-binding protein [Paenibacillus sp. PK3_47]UQZ32206.1 DNA-binding protein [Paenibacillus sp. PK3_47]